MSDPTCSMHKLIADVAVFSRSDVALVRYSSGYDRQTGWFLPDDELQHLEHPDDAARRILAGQLGLNSALPRLDHIESFKGNDASWHLVFHFVVEVDEPGKIAPSSNLADLAWFPVDRLPEREAIAHHGWALDVIQTILANQVHTGKTNVDATG